MSLGHGSYDAAGVEETPAGVVMSSLDVTFLGEPSAPVAIDPPCPGALSPTAARRHADTYSRPFHSTRRPRAIACTTMASSTALPSG